MDKSIEQSIAPKSKRGGKRPGAGRIKGSRKAPKALKDHKISAGLESAAPSDAPKGITPKALLLASMRRSWVAAHDKAREARAVEDDVAILAAQSKDSLIQHGPEVARIMGWNTGSAAVWADMVLKLDQLRQSASLLRLESVALLKNAEALAISAAPYEHAKLANVDSKVSGELTIVQRRFSKPQTAETKGEISIRQAVAKQVPEGLPVRRD